MQLRAALPDSGDVVEQEPVAASQSIQEANAVKRGKSVGIRWLAGTAAQLQVCAQQYNSRQSVFVGE